MCVLSLTTHKKAYVLYELKLRLLLVLKIEMRDGHLRRTCQLRCHLVPEVPSVLLLFLLTL